MPRIKIHYPKNDTVFVTTIPVLISHINYGHHLGYDAMLAIMQEARVRFLKQYHLSETQIVEDVGILVTDVAVNYLAEAFHGDQLTVSLAIVIDNKKSCDFFYEISNSVSNKCIAVGKTGIYFYNRTLRKTVIIPAEFMCVITHCSGV